MQVQSYLFFDGRCEEAIEFYKKTLGAEVGMLMRWKDSPDKSCARRATRTRSCTLAEDRRTRVMASDGRNTGNPEFDGFAFSVDAKDETDADRLFNGCRRGGKVIMPLDQDVFFAALRHGAGQIRRQLDGYRRTR